MIRIGIVDDEEIMRLKIHQCNKGDFKRAGVSRNQKL